ncbi:hypothetical protein EV121DRAFT_176155, partial [Schizophyllum commune]
MTEHDTRNLLLPLLSKEMISIDVAAQKSECTIHMYSLYACIAQQAPKLEKLLLPNSSSAGLSGTCFPKLQTLTLRDVRCKDAPAVASMTSLQDLTIIHQTSTLSKAAINLVRQTARKADPLPNLVNLEVGAITIQALESILLSFPPLMTPKLCSLLITHCHDGWKRILDLLESRIAPTRLINLELWFRSGKPGTKTYKGQWLGLGLSRDHLRSILLYHNLLKLHISASEFHGFHIDVDDEDVKALAMACPKLIDIVLEGSAQQTTSRITLKVFKYL